MPRLVELAAFDVPEYATPERSPSKIVPCPYCRGFHVVSRDARFISLQCDAVRPEVADLIDGGPAPSRLIEVFVARKPLPETSDLWRLQPRELYEKPEYITQELATYLTVDLR